MKNVAGYLENQEDRSGRFVLFIKILEGIGGFVRVRKSQAEELSEALNSGKRHIRNVVAGAAALFASITSLWQTHINWIPLSTISKFTGISWCGLEISEEKTNIRHVTEGFDFLGLTIRSFKSNINKPGDKSIKIEGYKLIINPSQSSVKKFREKVKLVFHFYFDQVVIK